MKKFFQWAGIIVAIIVIGLIVWGFIQHEPVPVGKKSPQTDGIVRRMHQAINKAAWDTTAVVAWSFGGRHDFVWDKKNHLVEVTWGNKRVLLNPNKISGRAFVKGEEITGSDAKELIQTAWSHFANDSFWLNAPAKVYDPGTERSLVIDPETERSGLLVNYTSGGVTPGDTYLWWLDENGLPEEWQMWVKIIPIGGIRSSWENWQRLASGALIATEHKLGGFTIRIENLRSAGSLAELGVDEKLFEGI